MSGNSKGAFDHRAYRKRRQNAEMFRDQYLYLKAADLFGQNLAVSSEYFNHDHANVLNDRRGLSECLAAIGVDEETWWLRHRLDKEAKETTKSQVNLARDFIQLGQFERAITLYQTILTTQKKTLGDAHPDTLNTRVWLASTLQRHGNVEEAYRHNLYLLDLLSKSRPVEDSDVIMCKHNLAINWCSFGDYERAMQLTVEGLQILRKTRPSGDSQLRMVEALRKNIDRSIQCLRRERRTEPGGTASARKEVKAVPIERSRRPGTRDHSDEKKKAALRNKSPNMYDARDGRGSLYTLTT